MHWVAHHTMRRARQDPDNDAFFADVDPAELRDFYPQIAVVVVLALAGVYLLVSGETGAVAMLILLATGALLVRQFHEAAVYWKRSIGDD